jgi:hypothetical protein
MRRIIVRSRDPTRRRADRPRPIRNHLSRRSAQGQGAGGMNATAPSTRLGTRVRDRVERPYRAADFGEELRGYRSPRQGAGIAEDDFAGDRLEGGAEPLHRLDRDCAVARRVDAE